MSKKFILNESQFKMLVEALAVEPYLQDLKDMAVKCADAINKFRIELKSAIDWNTFDGVSYPEEINGWEYDGNLEDDLILSYARYMGEIGDTGVNVILIYRPSEYRVQASFNSNNNEIWVFARGDSSTSKIYEKLTHEMTHAIDCQHGLIDLNFNSEWMRDDEKLPECIESLFYYLWNTSEFNAHQVGALSRANPKEIYAYWYNFFTKLYMEADEYDENDEVWLHIWKEYIRPDRNSRVSPKHAKEYFMKRTWMLIEKFIWSISKKTYQIKNKS